MELTERWCSYCNGSGTIAETRRPDGSLFDSFPVGDREDEYYMPGDEVERRGLTVSRKACSMCEGYGSHFYGPGGENYKRSDLKPGDRAVDRDGPEEWLQKPSRK